MNELQQLRAEIKKAQASSSIENLKLIKKLYDSVVEEFKDADLEKEAQLLMMQAEIDHFPTLLKDLETGLKGEKGDPGERGERGVDGKNGGDGRDGIDGKDGQDGKDGVDGKDGSDADLDGDEIITRINDSEDLIDKERVEGLKEIEAKADMALSRPMGVPSGGGGGASGVRSISSGINTTVTSTNEKYVINSHLSIVSKTTDYTATSADTTILADATSADVTITLPTSVSGKIYNIKKTDSSVNDVIIDGNGSETIDDATTATIENQYECVTVQGDGSNWHII